MGNAQEWGTFPGQGRVSVVSELSYDEYKNNVSAEVRVQAPENKNKE